MKTRSFVFELTSTAKIWVAGFVNGRFAEVSKLIPDPFPYNCNPDALFVVERIRPGILGLLFEIFTVPLTSNVYWGIDFPILTFPRYGCKIIALESRITLDDLKIILSELITNPLFTPLAL